MFGEHVVVGDIKGYGCGAFQPIGMYACSKHNLENRNSSSLRSTMAETARLFLTSSNIVLDLLLDSLWANKMLLSSMDNIRLRYMEKTQ